MIQLLAKIAFIHVHLHQQKYARLNVQLWYSQFTLTHKLFHSRSINCKKHFVIQWLMWDLNCVGTVITCWQCVCLSLSFIWLVVSLLHGSIFPEKIESLYLLNDKFSSGHQFFDLFRVCHIFILHESWLQAVSEIRWALRILTTKIQQL